MNPSLAWVPHAKVPLTGRIALVVLIALCAVAAHQATYLLGVGGPRDELAAAAHDAYWPPLVAVVLIAALALAVVSLRQLRRLSAHAGHLTGESHTDQELSGYAWAVGGLWLRLALATAAVYALQENLERIGVGLAPSGLDALAAHGLVPIVVITLATLVVAAVVALVRWRCQALLARLASTSSPRSTDVRRTRPRLLIRLPERGSLGARGSRAPPVMAAVI